MEKALQTCMEMFQQREYTVIDVDDDRVLAKKYDETQVCAFIVDTPKFNVVRVQEYISLMNSMGISHSVIVYKDNATPVAKKVVENASGMTIELFTQEEMSYNITKHRLVPLHQKLPDEDAQAFKKQFGTKFPEIKLKDPVARFYAYSRGDIIKITRKNGYIAYRIVKG
jgi:DNA-directed RNA polymerase I, II, and III subunit RPABC1